MSGLTSQEATKKLLQVADAVLEDHKAAQEQQRKAFPRALFHTELALAVASVIGQLVFFIYGVSASQSSYQSRYYGGLIESLLIAFLTIWNIGLYRREARLTNLEVVTRIETVLDDIRESGFLELQSIPTTIPTITVARVVRDGQVQTMPFTLLVEGDVLLLAYGDVSPGRMRHIAPPPQATPTPHMTTSAAAAAAAASSSSSSHPIPPAVSSASHPHSHYNTSSPSMQVQNVVIEKGCVLTFDMIASTQNSSLTGFFHFELLETPLVDTLKASLNYSRPETVIIWQIKKLRHFLLSRVVWSVLGLSMLINLIRFSVQYTLFQVSPSASSIPSDSASIASQAIEMLLSFQIYILILLLPLWLPTMCLVARSYGNAQILSLLDALQTSKVQFKDKDDIDEFDAAPPPTKDIATEWRAIAEKFWDQLIRFDVEFLARTTGLIESLANTTVICTVDREGTISMPFPTVDKLFLLSDTGDPVVLDVVELPHSIKFEDQDWEKYLGTLRPLGLNILLNSDCAAQPARTKNVESHRRFNSFLLHGCVDPAQQSCLCQLSGAIGFSDDVVSKYVSKRCIQTFAPYNITAEKGDHPNMFTQIVLDKKTNNMHLMTDGNLQLIVECCDYFWSGEELAGMNETIKRRIIDFYQNALISDMQVVAYSYSPVLSDDKITTMEEGLLNPSYLELKPPPSSSSESSSETLQIDENFVLKGQTFLCMASFYYQPKANVIDFIEDLGLAGIRFVYFSSAKERESKAYAERLGLEIDWNACILLSSPDGNGQGYLELHDIKAQLPRGVENVRSHLRDVDDIPLHVSLFAECSSPSVKEMVKIFQEYGEVVCCIGSSLDQKHADVFALADIAVSVDPVSISRHPKQTRLSNLAAGSMLSTIPCALSLHCDTSLYSLTQLIREARTLAQNSKQGFFYYIGNLSCLAGCLLITYALGMPPIFTGYQLIWLTWILLPFISTSFLFTSHDAEVMTFMPVKNTKNLKDKWIHVRYYFYRFCLPSVSVVAFFASIIQSFEVRLNLKTLGYSAQSWPFMTLQTPEQVAVLVCAQVTTMLLYILHAVIMSASFLRKTRFITEAPPYQNIIWIITCVACILLQFVFTIAFVSATARSYQFFSIPWYSYVIGIISLIVNLPLQETVKVIEKKDESSWQRRMKLEFNTKLGMHSPL